METVTARPPGSKGLWRVENVEGVLYSLSEGGVRYNLSEMTTAGIPWPKLILMSELRYCGFSQPKKRYVSCTYLPSKALQLGFWNKYPTLLHLFTLLPGEKYTFEEEDLLTHREPPLVVESSSANEPWISLDEALHLVKQVSATPAMSRPLFFTKKVKPTNVPKGKIPHRSVTLYNNGEQLYVKSKIGGFVHLNYRHKHQGVLCTTITGCDFLEKGIVLKHLGHNLSQDAIVTFIDQLHNWHLTVVVKKNQMIGIDDLSDAMRVVRVTE